MTLTELFRMADAKCEICSAGIENDHIESHGKNFCSIDCMQEYLIRIKETKLKRTRK